MPHSTFQNETQRVDAVYTKRGYDDDSNYNDFNPVYLHRVHSMERAMLAALRSVGLHQHLDDLKVLDFGCGNGKWLGRWMAWGAVGANLVGVDLRSKCIELATSRLSPCCFKTMADGNIPFDDASFGVVAQNVVFSSILDNHLRHSAAAEMQRVLKPGGYILWCDFIFSNPSNANVRAVTKEDIRSLFPTFKEVMMRKIILAPPIARRLVPISWLAVDLVEACFPFLRTHVVALLQKS
ncbi:MAG: methyltransferase domain-containing protein [Desulfobaccales bacterium]